jgi:signal peptidase I
VIIAKKPLLICFVLALCVGLLLALPRMSIMQVTSISMEDTLHDGDLLLIDKVSENHHSHWWNRTQPSHGQIVVFLAPLDRGEMDVKRVIGMPGDVVSIRRGRVFVNGRDLDESYVRWERGYNPAEFYWPIESSTSRSEPGFRVPQGYYFVLGDNRAVSLDSRSFGPVPREDIVGTVIWVISSKVAWSE